MKGYGIIALVFLLSSLAGIVYLGANTEILFDIEPRIPDVTSDIFPEYD